jgi:RNA binding exosome subunit
MGAVEIRVVAERPEDVQAALEAIKTIFPDSLISEIKSNDKRTGFRGYLSTVIQH